MQGEPSESDMKTQAVITWSDAGAPLGRFTLIRKGNDLCALRFTEYHRGGDAKPATVFDSGQESLYAEYDWFYQADHSGNLTKGNVKTGHRKIAMRSVRGIGRLSLSGGVDELKCGPFNLNWSYPPRIGFFGHDDKDGDHGIEIAPTKWTDIKQVNPHDPHLKWYRYDAKRKPIYIPADDL